MSVGVSSASGVGYYCAAGGGSQSRQSYYTGATAQGDEPGVWRGRLAADLGLSGEVTAQAMTPVYTKFLAPDGSKLGRAPAAFRAVEARVEAWQAEHPEALPEQVDEARRAFEADQRDALLAVDLTWSPPKSVTVAVTAARRAENEARASGDEASAEAHGRVREAIEAAIWEANEACMAEMEALAVARAGSHDGRGVGYWVAAPDHVRTSFHQHTARPVKGSDRASIDPQEHIHNVVLNRARCSDGVIRALDTQDLKAQRPAISAVADRVLAQAMARAGMPMEMRPDGINREVKVVDPAISDLFSQRRKVITRAMEPVVERAEQRLGRSLTELERSRIARDMTLFTRVAKSSDTDLETLLDDWQDRLKAELGRGLGPLAEQLRVMHEAARDPLAPAEFSPAGVAAVALCAVQKAAGSKGTWTRADLLLEVEKAMPLTPEFDSTQTRALLHRVTEMAIAQHATQVSGRDTLPDLGADRPGLGFQRPSAERFAAPETIVGEQRIREAAATRGRPALDVEAVDAWLTANYPTIGADQRAAVLGMATSDAALSMLSAPAGTGKSFATGAFAGAWEALGGGRVHGLTVSEIASQVLRQDGVESSSNIAAFLAAQDRIAGGRAREGDEQFGVGPNDVLVVDEASMVSTEQMNRILDIADRVGAKVVGSGDPEQLGSVEAGGAMDLLVGRADTFTLTEVRRFAEQWERDASLGLRHGTPEALAEYDRHGRLLGYQDPREAVAGAARAAAADRLAGMRTLVVAGSNEEASSVAAAIREHLVEAGIVEAGGVLLGLDGNTAGVGDEVMARQIDRTLGVVNRERLTVVGVRDDGGLSVVTADGEERELPAAYVAEHVQSAYASTVHAAQGVTVDRAHYLTSGGADPSAAYVGLTRGRERNTAHVATVRPGEGPQAGNVEVHEQTERPSPLAVLAGCFAVERPSPSAVVTSERDAEREAGMAHLLGRLEGGTSLAVRQRLDRALDGLHDEGLLSTEDRARMCADKASDHLARLLRAVEQAGGDPDEALRAALTERDLDGAQSVAQVLAHRLSSAHDVAMSAPGRSVPGNVGEPLSKYLGEIRDRMDDRTRVLGEQVVVEAPQWAAKALGPVPEDPVERLEWQDRAGRIAAYREATGWEDPDRAISHAPGVTTTERRGLWWEAWEALGRPEATREEAGLSDGALRARVAAWEREKSWAPPHADDAMRQSEQQAERARQEAVLARSVGDEETAARIEAEAQRQAAIVRTMDRVAAGRSAWNTDTAETRAVGERAAEELRSRGIAPGEEPDRTTAEEWMAADRAAREADDAHREITERDVEDPVAEEVRRVLPEPDRTGEVILRSPEPDAPDRSSQRAPLDPSPEAQVDLVAAAAEAQERAADHESEVAAWEATVAEQEPEPVQVDTPQVEAAEISAA